MRDCCPSCGSKVFVRNGLSRHGAQNHRCMECRRQFVKDPQSNSISQEVKRIINNLLLERLSLRGICRATGVSMSWLLEHISDLYEQIPDDLGVVIPSNFAGIALTRVEADELWSFVGSKQNRQWVWLALDTTTKQVIACHIGGREKEDARKLWDAIPTKYKNESDFFTDMHDAYRGVIPEDRLYQVKKKVDAQA